MSWRTLLCSTPKRARRRATEPATPRPRRYAVGKGLKPATARRKAFQRDRGRDRRAFH